MATVLALQLCVTFAEPVSDRIIVTVRGHGPDVVLIPGLASSGAVWDATVRHLEGHHRLHIVQIAGFASAPARANAQGPVIQPTLDALDAYIKTNKLKSPKVIGHSLGGLMGMMLALQHPEDAGSLIYTLLGSCRRHRINPFDYLKDLFTRLPAAKITEIKQFTPAAWAKGKEKSLVQADSSAVRDKGLLCLVNGTRF